MRSMTLLLALAGCSAAGASSAPAAGGPTRSTPAWPAACREIAPGGLQAALTTAQPNDILCLAPGEHPGPVTLGDGVTVWGPPDAVIKTSGEGTTVLVHGRGASLLGLTVDGSGGRYDTLDAAVKVEGASDVRIEGIAVRRAVFGIMSDRSERVTIRGNHVVGTNLPQIGMRGDSIRLWETKHSLVEGNLVEHGRDVVVWYATDNVVRGNVVRHGRYGTHLMYSHRNLIEGNRYENDVVGVFVMYSRDVDILDNLMADASGGAGMGFGAKESGNLRVVGNRFLHDTIGVYLDTSPLQDDDTNLFERNVFRLGEAGVVFHSSETRNTFRSNSFRDNHVPVRVEGGGDALQVTWEGNDFDDYAGYDLDGDRTGDIPYELRSLSADLISRHPNLEFFRGSTTLALVNMASQVVPLLAPKTLLRDESPRMQPLEADRAD